MFVELHLIQNFAPSNLNRDDTGAPKDCEFGGYRRARISSQCLKRAVRTAFKDHRLLPPEHLATRTKRLADELTRRLRARGKGEAEARARPSWASSLGVESGGVAPAPRAPQKARAHSRCTLRFSQPQPRRSASSCAQSTGTSCALSRLTAWRR